MRTDTEASIQVSRCPWCKSDRSPHEQIMPEFSKFECGSEFAPAAIMVTREDFEYRTPSCRRMARLRYALTCLHAVVEGECPALLDEDRGGNGALDIEIEELIS